MKIVAFIHPYVIPNTYAIHSSVEHRRKKGCFFSMQKHHKTLYNYNQSALHDLHYISRVLKIKDWQFCRYSLLIVPSNEL